MLKYWISLFLASCAGQMKNVSKSEIFPAWSCEMEISGKYSGRRVNLHGALFQAGVKGWQHKDISRNFLNRASLTFV